MSMALTLQAGHEGVFSVSSRIQAHHKISSNLVAVVAVCKAWVKHYPKPLNPKVKTLTSKALIPKCGGNVALSHREP